MIVSSFGRYVPISAHDHEGCRYGAGTLDAPVLAADSCDCGTTVDAAFMLYEHNAAAVRQHAGCGNGLPSL